MKTSDRNLLYEITVRKALPILITKIMVLELVFIALYGVILWYLNDYSATPLKSGGLLIFLFIQSVKFFWGLFLVLAWFFRSYDITPDQIITHRGIVFQEKRYFSLRKVETLTMNQGFWGRIFNFGTVHVELYMSNQKYDVKLHNIPKPDRYVTIIEKRLRILTETHDPNDADQ